MITTDEIADLTYAGMIFRCIWLLGLISDKAQQFSYLMEMKDYYNKINNKAIKMNLDMRFNYHLKRNINDSSYYLWGLCNEGKSKEVMQKCRRISGSLFDDIGGCYMTELNIYFNKSRKKGLELLRKEKKKMLEA